KLVFPQVENHPSQFQHLDFQHFYLQPLDNSNRTGNTKACIDFCMENPLWKLSVQTHKDIGIA
ncbi:MAG: 7-carboxy-7-deazaguanine synthase, partial [Saprospiraceae bacterium]